MGAGTINIILWVALIAVFWLFFIRPQQKKQKEQDNFLNSLKKGDQVATASGIIGRITRMEESVIELQIDNKSFMKVLKSAISKEITEGLKGKNYIE